MRFTKMHGCGNDYIYIDCFSQREPSNISELAIRLSKPHTGIGADGIILIEPSNTAHARMRIFNRDGSEGEMCGNGIRCVGKYLYDSGIAREPIIYVETLGGVKTLRMLIENGVATGARADMGRMVFEPKLIPVNAQSNRITLNHLGLELNFFCVNAGNPHAVCANYFPTDEEFESIGSACENDEIFPERANISFIQPLKRDLIRARIWERGSGATMACGSGATASAVASYLMGLTDPKATVRLPGGELFIEYDPETAHAYMTGPAETVFTGEYPD